MGLSERKKGLAHGKEGAKMSPSPPIHEHFPASLALLFALAIGAPKPIPPPSSSAATAIMLATLASRVLALLCSARTRRPTCPHGHHVGQQRGRMGEALRQGNCPACSR
jgi:hypothetical protein